LQINPDHVVAAVPLAKQLSPESQHATTVVCVSAVVDVYDATHEVALAAHE
jgi:hypothetical protein